MNAEFVKAAKLSDLKEAVSLPITIGEQNLLICYTNKGVFVVENKCSHQKTALHGGKIKSCFIFCPLHGQRFDLRDGKPKGKLTDKPLLTFLSKVEGGDIWVNPKPIAELS